MNGGFGGSLGVLRAQIPQRRNQGPGAGHGALPLCSRGKTVSAHVHLSGEILAFSDHVPDLKKLRTPLERVQRESFGAEGQETVQLGSVNVSGHLLGASHWLGMVGGRYRETEDPDPPLRLWGT